jgi:hypothetical protein
MKLSRLVNAAQGAPAPRKRLGVAIADLDDLDDRLGGEYLAVRMGEPLIESRPNSGPLRHMGHEAQRAGSRRLRRVGGAHPACFWRVRKQTSSCQKGI